MNDVIVSIVTPKDTVEFYFERFEDAYNFIHTAIYAAYNQDPDQVVQFCIRADNKSPDEPAKATSGHQ